MGSFSEELMPRLSFEGYVGMTGSGKVYQTADVQRYRSKGTAGHFRKQGGLIQF